MKTSSAKAKGRRLQQEVARQLREVLKLTEEDIKSTPMGTQGPDVWLSSRAREDFPFAVECKNTEKINIWAAIRQAEANSTPGAIAPCVVFSKNRHSPYVAIELDRFLTMVAYIRIKARG